MSRLIDADPLIAEIEEYEKLLGKVGYNTNGSDFVVNVIRNQPTAYDVDEMVRELEISPELVISDSPLHGKYIKKNIAIEIVKRGGRNE